MDFRKRQSKPHMYIDIYMRSINYTYRKGNKKIPAVDCRDFSQRNQKMISS